MAVDSHAQAWQAMLTGRSVGHTAQLVGIRITGKENRKLSGCTVLANREQLIDI